MRTIERARSRIDEAGTSWSWGDTAPETAEKPRLSALRRIAPRKPGLADPRLAGQQQELATPGQDILEAPVGQVEQVVASDEERTADGAWRTVHRLRSVGQPRNAPSVIRPMPPLT